MSWLWFVVPAYLAWSYYKSVVAQPVQAAREARAYADGVGKPMGDIGCGTPGSSVRVALFGPTVKADVRCDPSADKSTACGPDTTCYCDAYHLDFPDRYFGSVLASHFLANLDRPEDALAELLRVSDRVYIVLPKWWAPGSWVTHAAQRPVADLGVWKKLQHERSVLRGWSKSS